MIFENYGIEGLFDHLNESTFYLLRFFKYRACDQIRDVETNNFGLGAHTDSSFISILHQHQVKGLQVLTKDGQRADVKPSVSSFLVLAGDLLKVYDS